MEGTIRCGANYVPLSPISFLERSAVVYSDRSSIVYGDHINITWRQTHQRCLKLASSLASRFQISRGDVVSFITLLHSYLYFVQTLSLTFLVQTFHK